MLLTGPMKASLKLRESVADVRRVVVKIGSRVLVQKTGRPEHRRIRSLVAELARLRQNGIDLVVITSGARYSGVPHRVKVRLNTTCSTDTGRQVRAPPGARRRSRQAAQGWVGRQGIGCSFLPSSQGGGMHLGHVLSCGQHESPWHRRGVRSR